MSIVPCAYETVIVIAAPGRILMGIAEIDFYDAPRIGDEPPAGVPRSPRAALPTTNFGDAFIRDGGA